MDIIGGMGGFRSVLLLTENYKSIGVLKNNTINVYIEEREKDNKFIKIISKIPFIRAYSTFISILFFNIKNTIFFLSLSLILSIIINIENKALDSTTFNFISNSSYGSIILMFIILVFVVKFTDLGKYHAAEHMVINAYENTKDISLENVRKSSRIHNYCGTNLVTGYMVVYIILYQFIDNTFLLFLLSWSLAYEISYNRDILKPLWLPILIIGKFLQFALATSKPKDIHLKVAIKALEEIIEKEENKTSS